MYWEGLSPSQIYSNTQQITRAVSWQPEGFQNLSETKRKKIKIKISMSEEIDLVNCCTILKSIVERHVHWFGLVLFFYRKGESKATVAYKPTAERLLQQNYLGAISCVLKWVSISIFLSPEHHILLFSHQPLPFIFPLLFGSLLW